MCARIHIFPIDIHAYLYEYVWCTHMLTCVCMYIPALFAKKA